MMWCTNRLPTRVRKIVTLLDELNAHSQWDQRGLDFQGQQLYATNQAGNALKRLLVRTLPITDAH